MRTKLNLLVERDVVDSPTFLASVSLAASPRVLIQAADFIKEARRILTPPMDSASPALHPNPFDTPHSSTSSFPPSRYSSFGSPTKTAPWSRQSTPPSGFRTRTEEKQAVIEAYKTRMTEQADSRPSFNLSLPDHLPSSPLCPANLQHESGGAGICPYHGRRKGKGDVVGLQVVMTPGTDSSGEERELELM